MSLLYKRRHINSISSVPHNAPPRRRLPKPVLLVGPIQQLASCCSAQHNNNNNDRFLSDDTTQMQSSDSESGCARPVAQHNAVHNNLLVSIKHVRYLHCNMYWDYIYVGLGLSYNYIDINCTCIHPYLSSSSSMMITPTLFFFQLALCFNSFYRNIYLQ